VPRFSNCGFAMPRTLKQAETIIGVFQSAPGSSRICKAIEPAFGYMSDEELRGLAEFVRYQAFLRQRRREVDRSVVPTVYEKYEF
jgi:hypothetical protein